MIDEKLRQAVLVFSQTGHVALDEISENLRTAKLPREPKEALAVFRHAMHRHTFHACAAAVERIELSYDLGRLRYFYQDQISRDGSFWWSFEDGALKIVSDGFRFLAEEFSPLVSYVENGVTINGVLKKEPSQYEHTVLPDLRRATRSLYNSRDEVAVMSAYFTERAKAGLPPFDKDEAPATVENPRAAFKGALSDIALNFKDCIALEEEFIRTSMAYAHFLDRHKAMFNVMAQQGKGGSISAAAVFQLSVRQHLARAGEYDSLKGFLEFKAIECSSLGGQRLLPA